MAKGETYEEFVAKFKKNAPKTTDDCYTPQPVYEVVKEYAQKQKNEQKFENKVHRQHAMQIEIER